MVPNDAMALHKGGFDPTFGDEQIKPELLLKKLEALGYPPTPAHEKSTHTD